MGAGGGMAVVVAAGTAVVAAGTAVVAAGMAAISTTDVFSTTDVSIISIGASGCSSVSRLSGGEHRTTLTTTRIHITAPTPTLGGFTATPVPRRTSSKTAAPRARAVEAGIGTIARTQPAITRRSRTAPRGGLRACLPVHRRRLRGNRQRGHDCERHRFRLPR